MKGDIFHLLDNVSPKVANFHSRSLKKKAKNIKIKSSNSTSRLNNEPILFSLNNILSRKFSEPEFVETERTKQIKNCLTKTLERNLTPKPMRASPSKLLKKSRQKSKKNILMCESPKIMNFNKRKLDEPKILNTLTSLSSLNHNTNRELPRDVSFMMRLEFMNAKTSLDLSHHNNDDLNLLSETNSPPSPKKQFKKTMSNLHKRTRSSIMS